MWKSNTLKQTCYRENETQTKTLPCLYGAIGLKSCAHNWDLHVLAFGARSRVLVLPVHCSALQECAYSDNGYVNTFVSCYITTLPCLLSLQWLFAVIVHQELSWATDTQTRTRVWWAWKEKVFVLPQDETGMGSGASEQSRYGCNRNVQCVHWGSLGVLLIDCQLYLHVVLAPWCTFEMYK